MSLLAVVALAAMTPKAAFQPLKFDTLITSFSDGDFIDAPTGPWVYTTIVTDARAHPVSTHSASGGNPNDFRDDKITFDSSPKSYSSVGVILALNSTATWTPTSSPTAFSRLSFNCDTEILPTSGGDDNHYALVEQGGKYYMALAEAATVFAWTSYSVPTLVATDFNELNTTTLMFNTSSHPDFVTGSTMTFGYAYWGQHNGPGVLQGELGIDNWLVELYRS